MDNILLQLNSIFAKVLKRKKLSLELTDSPKTINGWDSLTHVIIISEIEEKFDIEFSILELANLQDINDIVNLVSSKINK